MTLACVNSVQAGSSGDVFLWFKLSEKQKNNEGTETTGTYEAQPSHLEQRQKVRLSTILLTWDATRGVHRFCHT